MTMAQRAEQFRYTLQLFARTLDEEKVLMIATILTRGTPKDTPMKSVNTAFTA